MKENASNGIIVFWLFTIAAVVGAAYILSPFIPAILWATVFSVLLYPFFNRLIARGWNRTLAALFVTLIPTILLIIPLAVLGTLAGVQVYGYATELVQSSKTAGDSNVLTTVAREIDAIITPLLKSVGAKDVDVVELISQNQSQIGKQIFAPITLGLKSFVITIVTLVISLLTMFFMVRDSHHMERPLIDIIPLPVEKTKAILTRIAVTVRSVFIGVFFVAIIQGLLAGIAYAVVGVNGWLVWMLITTILCMIPLLGSPVAYVPIALSLILQGHVVQGIGLLLFGFFIISQIDNFLRPFFIGASAKLHPMPIFFALLGGVLILGPVGLMAGPMLLTVLLAITDILRNQDEDAIAEPSLV